MEFEITRYRSLYDTSPQATESYTWAALCTLLSTFTVTSSKFSVAGFGAHVLLPGQPRGVVGVDRVSLFAFDVDAGTPDEVARSIDLIHASNVSLHVYSSHSHCEAKPALRFVIPPSRPMSPAEYPGFRAAVIARYRVPCKPEQSGDVSRFWFLPSHHPNAKPYHHSKDGVPLDLGSVTVAPVVVRPKPATTWQPPPEPPTGTAVDVAPLREKLQRRATSLRRSDDPAKKRRGDALSHLLKAEPLAEHGSRNATTFSTCRVIVNALPPDVPLSSLMLLIRPSLLAMQAAGSSLTEEKVERMFLTAMQKKAEDRSDLDAFLENQRRIKAGMIGESR